MTSSIGAGSGLNLALLSQLLQRAEGGTGTDSALGSATSSDQSTDSSPFNSEADALFSALDTDGDGKLSKSEIQTGFQKLSQSMQAVLLQQQGGTAGSETSAPQSAATGIDHDGFANIFSSLDTDGDGVVSASEFDAGLNAATNSQATSGDTGTASVDVAELLTSLLQSLRDSSSASLFSSFDGNGDGSISQSEFIAGISAANNTSSSDSSASSGSASSSGTKTSASGDTSLFTALDSNGDGSISSDEWAKLLTSEPGDLANQQAMAGWQQSNNLNASLMFMLQSVDGQQAAAGAASAV